MLVARHDDGVGASHRATMSACMLHILMTVTLPLLYNEMSTVTPQLARHMCYYFIVKFQHEESTQARLHTRRDNVLRRWRQPILPGHASAGQKAAPGCSTSTQCKSPLCSSLLFLALPCRRLRPAAPAHCPCGARALAWLMYIIGWVSGFLDPVQQSGNVNVARALAGWRSRPPGA